MIKNPPCKQARNFNHLNYNIQNQLKIINNKIILMCNQNKEIYILIIILINYTIKLNRLIKMKEKWLKHYFKKIEQSKNKFHYFKIMAKNKDIKHLHQH